MNETTTRVGIIGGTGLGEILLKETDGKTVDIDTPFGKPSSPPLLANWEGVEVVFLARHGEGHRFNPTRVPYRANIWAMKSLGVSRIMASGATGSLREDIKPGHLVLCDQVIDKTTRRHSTFFDEGLAVHVELADPFCPQLRALLIAAGRHLDSKVHPCGTYICMEGPQFSTRAESNMHRQWGGDLIGMTAMPEAKLAREAQICYSLIALPTDYDCWRGIDPSQGGGAPKRGQEELLREILGNLQQAGNRAIALIRQALKQMKTAQPPCLCQEALKLAVWTDKSLIGPRIREKLAPLITPHLAD